MATLTIRELDDETRERLRVRAAQHGRSMEAEVRAILRDLLSSPPPVQGLGSRIHARFAAIGGSELEVAPRSEAPRAALDELRRRIEARGRLTYQESTADLVRSVRDEG